MAASVLKTPRAIEVSLFVVRVFVRLRNLVANHEALARKLDELEQKVTSHDTALRTLVKAIRQLMQPPPAAKRPQIGFHVRSDEE